MIALSRFLEKMLKALVIVANAAMLLLVFGQVITRYVFGWTPHFGEELARYLFVWVVFLSLPLVARYGGHMCIETLTSRVKGATLKTLNILADIFSIAFLSIMVWNGVRMVMLADFQTSPAMMIPMSWVYVVIPFGCGVMLLYVLGNLVRVLKTPAAELK
ncbi:TRAP transporter small permease [Desulfovibrio fairfieldensis]|uniref:C4-dicarboxylate ABC transporter substrate-binding protein n=1 Tax=Desulfovibrio fairfieldensis TaxID=44742 RepID=A0A0X8JID6_9BACT|nr:TRAP transporter small permease [Desulfovibrio fairfieldensis]AMD89362.1 C4-dicarboxylate ABC transporter substrate-binding protein [Desulfovibrio fairfieldensis]